MTDYIAWGLKCCRDFLQLQTLFLLSPASQGLTENCLTVYEEKLFLLKFHYYERLFNDHARF